MVLRSVWLSYYMICASDGENEVCISCGGGCGLHWGSVRQVSAVF